MKAKSIVGFAVRSMGYSNIRTLLTLAAIIIGVFSVALLTGISKGTEDHVLSRLKSLGTDVITIIPLNVVQSGTFSAGMAQYRAITEKFVESDVKKIMMVEGVKEAIPTLSSSSLVEYGDKSFRLSVYAAPFDADQVINGVTIDKGRWLSGKYDAVLGGSIENITGVRMDVGKKMSINSVTFTIVGIMNRTGASQANLDNTIYIPYETGREMFRDTYGTDEISAIVVKVSSGYDTNAVGADIERNLMFYKKITDPKKEWFTVVTPAFIDAQVSNVTGTLNLFFIAVASISIIIGLVGVGNTMYMNVMDRTREIAVMKSIGAKRAEILTIYLLEGAALGAAGAVAGALAGIAIGTLISGIVPFSPDFMQTGIAIIFITMGSGAASYIPARIASGVNAADALRYE